GLPRVRTRSGPPAKGRTTARSRGRRLARASDAIALVVRTLGGEDGVPHGGHGLPAFVLTQAVDEQLSVQVVGLVLQDASEQLFPFERDRLTPNVEALHASVHRARRVEPQVR